MFCTTAVLGCFSELLPKAMLMSVKGLRLIAVDDQLPEAEIWLGSTLVYIFLHGCKIRSILCGFARLRSLVLDREQKRDVGESQDPKFLRACISGVGQNVGVRDPRKLAWAQWILRPDLDHS